ncbi:hypothetical protein HanRHA438_Chr17g0806131 [Helianthus annuus]|nr:hypothetical protein HanRHA438_Chr17g0806131 [Helianthus annuus]
MSSSIKKNNTLYCATSNSSMLPIVKLPNPLQTHQCCTRYNNCYATCNSLTSVATVNIVVELILILFFNESDLFQYEPILA